ncbi:hypothetical protein SAMN04489731_12846 [Amycolatopsis regifaucium]|nr:hypothetical protein SAMN04489731_12846 [Amycolatopsis regifaucium]
MALQRQATALTQSLHREIGKLNPEQELWRADTSPDLDDYVNEFAAEPGILRLAWDEDRTVLLSRKVYATVLDLVDAPISARRAVWRKYNEAEQAVQMSRAPVAVDQEVRRAQFVLRAKVLARRAAQFTADVLQGIHSEQAFIGQLKVLKDRAGLSNRTLAARLHDRAGKDAPAASTLGDWFTGDRLPPVGEPVMRMLIETLLDHLDGDLDAELLDRHMHLWRALIAQRHAPDLLASPLRDAVERLTWLQENATGRSENYQEGLNVAISTLKSFIVTGTPAGQKPKKTSDN